MVPYILLILIPALCLFVSVENKNGAKVLHIGKSKYTKDNSIAISMFFILFFLLLALRDESIGNDTTGYLIFFNAHNTKRFSDTLLFGFEPVYSFLNWIVNKFTHNFQIYLIIVAAINVLPLAKIYNEDKRNSFLKIILFLNMTTFIMFFSGIRQALAMSVGMIAYKFVKEKKPLWFIITCLVAIGFHHSAFMLFFMYPLYYFSLKRKHLLFIVPIMIISHIYNAEIFSNLTYILSLFSNEYSNIETEETGAIATFLMFIAFAVFSYTISDEKKMDRNMVGLRNFLLFSVFLQSFASVHILAMRMNYYYIMFIPLLIAKIVEVPKKEFVQVSYIIEKLITFFFVGYFLYSLYNSYISGTSTLSTIPYAFFWER